jgi:hypothetical protein
MIKMKATGYAETRLFLQKVSGRTTKAIRDEMVMVANDTAELAMDMAPEEYGDLVGAIHVVENADTKSRFHVSIIAGGMSKAGVNVSRYAAIMHENYESILSDPETIERRDRKQRRTGQIVGSKFLERALEATDKTLANRLGRALLLVGGIEQ